MRGSQSCSSGCRLWGRKRRVLSSSSPPASSHPPWTCLIWLPASRGSWKQSSLLPFSTGGWCLYIQGFERHNPGQAADVPCAWASPVIPQGWGGGNVVFGGDWEVLHWMEQPSGTGVQERWHHVLLYWFLSGGCPVAFWCLPHAKAGGLDWAPWQSIIYHYIGLVEGLLASASDQWGQALHSLSYPSGAVSVCCDALCYLGGPSVSSRWSVAVYQQAGLTIHPWKCALAKEEVQYLGHVLGQGVIRPQKDKIQAVRVRLSTAPDQEGCPVVPGTGGLVPPVCAGLFLLSGTFVRLDPEIGLLPGPVGGGAGAGILGLEGCALQGPSAPELLILDSTSLSRLMPLVLVLGQCYFKVRGTIRSL